MSILSRVLTLNGRRIGERAIRLSPTIVPPSIGTSSLRVCRGVHNTARTASLSSTFRPAVQHRLYHHQHQQHHRPSSHLALLGVLGVGAAIVLLDPEPLFANDADVLAEAAAAGPDEGKRRSDANLALIRRTFDDRSTFSLIRSLLIYELCAYPWIVSLASKVISMAEHLPLLQLPVRFALRETAFRQFCGGETVEETLPLLIRMHRQNISGILDLSIEADVGQATRNMREDAAATARGESAAYWQTNRQGQTTRANHVMELIERGILAGKAAPGTFFAVKCTALASDPEVFEHWSAALRRVRREFDDYTGRTATATATADEERSAVLDPPVRPREMDVEEMRRLLARHTIDEAGFIALARPYLATDAGSDTSLSAHEAERQLKSLFRQLDTRQQGRLDWIDYAQLFDSERLRAGQIRLIPDEAEKCECMEPSADAKKVKQSEIYCCLHPDTQAEVLEALARLERLCEASIAKEDGETSVRLMIDAEQSYLQPAIAYLARQVSRKYNRDNGAPPQVYDTYQLYLRQGLQNLVEDMAMAERHGYHWAGKLVRGAYVSSERRYAQAREQPNAIWPSKPDTDRSYDTGAALAIQRASEGAAHVVVATHNNRSVARAIQLMEKLGQRDTDERPSLKQRIHFAQLLGMGELIATRVMEHGYQSAKYMPYGPVQEVVPYLLRRAEENGALFAPPDADEAVDGQAMDAGQPGEDRNAVIRVLRERLGWRRWFGLRQV